MTGLLDSRLNSAGFGQGGNRPGQTAPSPLRMSLGVKTVDPRGQGHGHRRLCPGSSN